MREKSLCFLQRSLTSSNISALVYKKLIAGIVRQLRTEKSIFYPRSGITELKTIYFEGVRYVKSKNFVDKLIQKSQDNSNGLKDTFSDEGIILI